jgi:hypothetical protein
VYIGDVTAGVVTTTSVQAELTHREGIPFVRSLHLFTKSFISVSATRLLTAVKICFLKLNMSNPPSDIHLKSILVAGSTKLKPQMSLRFTWAPHGIRTLQNNEIIH